MVIGLRCALSVAISVISYSLNVSIYLAVESDDFAFH